MYKKLRKVLLTGDLDFKEVLKHSFAAFLMLGLAGVVQFIFDLLLARKFDAHGVGVFYLSYSIIFMLSLLGRLGFNKAVVKYIPAFVRANQWPELRGLKKTADRSTLVISIFLMMIVLCLSSYIARDIFHQPEITNYIRIFALSLPPLSFMYVQTGFLSGLKLVKESVFIERTSVNLLAIAFIVLGGSRLGVNSAIIGTAVATFIFAFAASRLINSHIPKTNRVVLFDKKILFFIAAPLLFVDFSNQMTGQLNVLILGAQASASSVGIFNAALRVSAMIGIILTGVNAIATTKIAELHSIGDHEKLELLASKTAGFALLCGLPLIVLFFAFPQTILGFFGHEFASGAFALRLLVLAQMINLMFGSVVQILSMTGYHRELAYATVASVLILNTILSVILVPIYGLNGAAMAVAISLILKNIILLIMIKRYLNMWSLPFKAIQVWFRRG